VFVESRELRGGAYCLLPLPAAHVVLNDGELCFHGSNIKVINKYCKVQMAGAKGKSGGSRPGAGRSSFKPTEDQRKLVSQLSAFGIRTDEMPVFVMGSTGKPISELTLKKYFKKEIDHGRLKANFKVANSLYRSATEPTEKYPHGNTTAQIFWLKTQASWREAPQQHEVTGKDGAPIEQRTTVINEAQIKAAITKLEDDY
jgi:hypothetical protein